MSQEKRTEVAKLALRITEVLSREFAAELGSYHVSVTAMDHDAAYCGTAANCEWDVHLFALVRAIASICGRESVAGPQRAEIVAELAEQLGLQSEINAAKVDG